MKKVILPLTLLAAIGIAALYFVQTRRPHRPQAAEFVPAETLFFAQLPDVRTSARRWLTSDLHDLWTEPGMQAFLEQPLAKAPALVRLRSLFRDVRSLLPREAFIAVTSLDRPTPTFVAGFRFDGQPEDVETVLRQWRMDWRQKHRLGKADLIGYGSREIETFTDRDWMTGEAFCERWYFLSNDLTVLQRTLDRHDGHGSRMGPSLAADDRFQRAVRPLPGAPDLLYFARFDVLADRLQGLMVAAGHAPNSPKSAAVGRTEAFAGCTKIEGPHFRDALFVLSPGLAGEPPLKRETLAVSSATSFLYSVMVLPASAGGADPISGMMRLVPGFAGFEKGLADKQLSLSDFGRAFGPELGAVMEWPAGALQPAPLFVLQVRDPSMAAGFLDVLTAGGEGAPAWNGVEQAGKTIWSLPNADLAFVTPSVALADRFLVFGISPESVTAGLARLGSGEPGLARVPAFASSMGSVHSPTSGFGYVDLKAVFERFYGTFRPVLAASLAFSGETGRYFDAGKLPPAETIAQHLRPIVYSQAATVEGRLLESTGTLTLNQALVGIIAAAGATALPSMDKMLSGGMKLDPSSGFDPSRLLDPGTWAQPAPSSPAAPGKTPVELNPEEASRPAIAEPVEGEPPLAPFSH
ncbi:MAG: hypothetical protein M3463_01195 [Verrucomicrobiota bacterium]|nr:hypothetical protein [Verrucomicrobiota bacterium]